uniref:Proteoglycan 4a n=1 Tax=Scophthalmus maximus TaxID=52904 RepID=A0A8D2ZHH8_SCOMX
SESLSLSICILQLLGSDSVHCFSSGSCVGRCGEVFTRGQLCACDLSCMQHNECCPDFEATCTTAQSCLGRCGEPFRRGQQCECDPECVRHNTCCRDYQRHCGEGGPQPRPQQCPTSKKKNGAETGGIASRLLAGDVCSDSPIDGLTALSNGTILIFKGELFWSVDPVSRLPGRPQSITDRLGVSSPIDTVFTRCNCHRNTYIIKGDHFWRFDRNMVVEPGFPKPLASEFPGLTGTISAALAVPATRKRPETVYFFKGGDMMQSFTYAPGSTPSCSGKSRSSTHQAALQGGEIKIKLALRGFPTPVTSALSMPSPQRSDRYHHYVFSGSKHHHNTRPKSLHDM